MLLRLISVKQFQKLVHVTLWTATKGDLVGDIRLRENKQISDNVNCITLNFLLKVHVFF